MTWGAGCRTATLTLLAASTIRFLLAQLLEMLLSCLWHWLNCAACALQVKLRGMRVELGEIESALVDAPGVQLAAVLVLKDPAGAQRLVAYVTPASVDTAAVLASVKSRLPAHMVPSVVVLLAVMPLSPTGKVDRKALPEPDWSSMAVEEYVAPVSELEAQLQAILQDVLGQERISTQADFFSVGGNSLQVITLPLRHRLVA